MAGKGSIERSPFGSLLCSVIKAMTKKRTYKKCIFCRKDARRPYTDPPICTGHLKKYGPQGEEDPASIVEKYLRHAYKKCRPSKHDLNGLTIKEFIAQEVQNCLRRHPMNIRAMQIVLNDEPGQEDFPCGLRFWRKFYEGTH